MYNNKKNLVNAMLSPALTLTAGRAKLPALDYFCLLARLCSGKLFSRETSYAYPHPRYLRHFYGQLGAVGAGAWPSGYRFGSKCLSAHEYTVGTGGNKID